MEAVMSSRISFTSYKWISFSLTLILFLPVAPVSAAPNQATPTFRINPGSIQAGRTKGISITTDEGFDLMGFTIEPPADTDVTVEESKVTADKHGISATVKVSLDAEPQTLPLKLVKKTGTTSEVFIVNLAITEFKPRPIPRQAVPEGIEEAVDYMLQPMSYKSTEDVFGRRVADAYYAVVVGLGNNTGFDLQITKLGFLTTIPSLSLKFDDKGDPILEKDGKTLASRIEPLQVAAIDRTLVRSSIEKEQAFGKRALAMGLINGGGTFLSGFLPFFHAIGPRANFASFSSLFNGQLKEGFGLAVPDLTVRQLNRLENDIVMHEEMILPNNSEKSTVVFVPRSVLGLDKKHSTDGMDHRDDLQMVRERLGRLILVGRQIARFANRQIVVRTGAGGVTTEPRAPERLPVAPNITPSSATQPTPTIVRITPNSGPTTGSQETFITISGFATNAFGEAADVTVNFGDKSVIGALVSQTLVKTISPARPGAGTVDVEVIISDQKAKLTSGYTYLLTAEKLVPTSGPLTGGNTVTILGHGFVPGARVLFGSIQATNVAVAPDGNSITATVPPTLTPGNVNVKVINPDGKESSVPEAFTYLQSQ
jgi:hypothetical protein